MMIRRKVSWSTDIEDRFIQVALAIDEFPISRNSSMTPESLLPL